MTDETNEPIAPAAKVNVTGIRSVLKDIEDGLETVEGIPEHVVAWLKAKADEIKSHL